MRNRMYGGVRGRKTKVGEKLLRFPPTRFIAKENDDQVGVHATEQPDIQTYKDPDLVTNRYKPKKLPARIHRGTKILKNDKTIV